VIRASESCSWWTTAFNFRMLRRVQAACLQGMSTFFALWFLK
jgi:hypothetical protein